MPVCATCGRYSTNYLCIYCYSYAVNVSLPRQTQRQNMAFKRNYGPKTAQLIYEPALQGYSLKFSYEQAIVEFIKKVIPANKRTTSGPPDWIWYFGEEYFDVIRTVFEGHRDFKLTIVTRSEVEEMQRKQQESYHVVRPQEFSVEAEINKFQHLLAVGNGTIKLDNIKNWNRDEATKQYRRAAIRLHPDKPSGDASKMAELNTTWALLKEGYYIK